MGTVYLKDIQKHDDNIFIDRFPGDEKIKSGKKYKTLALTSPSIPIFLILYWLGIGTFLHVIILTLLFSFIFGFLIYLFFYDEDNFFRWFIGPRG